MLGQSVRAPARGMTCSRSFTLLVRQPKNGVSLVTSIALRRAVGEVAGCARHPAPVSGFALAAGLVRAPAETRREPLRPERRGV